MCGFQYQPELSYPVVRIRFCSLVMPASVRVGCRELTAMGGWHIGAEFFLLPFPFRVDLERRDVSYNYSDPREKRT